MCVQLVKNNAGETAVTGLLSGERGSWGFQEDLGLISMDELGDTVENTYTICRRQ